MFGNPAIYFLMGTTNAGTKEPLALLEEALQGGITHFQLREKGRGALTGDALAEFAAECKGLCREYGVPIFINDDVELACTIEADGIHIGQDDMDCGQVRKQIGASMALGVSVHSVKEANEALTCGATYLGMGPVFGTRTKSDAKPPAGVAEIIKVKTQYPHVPVIGIGGIEPGNAEMVWRAGVSGIAVISSIAGAQDVAGQIERFKQSIPGRRVG
ncbi:thiamine phosphate synthase [Planococcus rifietoensis]|uniref:thiamine phosphate synthase n=1 Tax=Planococcus rifietoensis TaxID=200991 RepID=UPI0026D8737B